MPTFPTIIQPDAMDCGPVALQMIAKYYGKDFDLDYLRKLTYTTREGVSLLSISNTAETLGFKTIGGKVSFEVLMRNVPLPCIVHWDQEHFVVVYHIKPPNKFRKEALVYVSDPAKGKITYTATEFKKHWISTKSQGEDKGVVLLLEPTRKFYSQKSNEKQKRSLSFLFSYFIKYRKY